MQSAALEQWRIWMVMFDVLKNSWQAARTQAGVGAMQRTFFELKEMLVLNIV